mmetsp:Transcript_23481/g.65286  ORF Transcript_23481/g.65286 Transcript_23481/m.65286 type:complete len:201 (-) Transcript_23481:777-1379(-)
MQASSSPFSRSSASRSGGAPFSQLPIRFGSCTSSCECAFASTSINFGDTSPWPLQAAALAGAATYSSFVDAAPCSQCSEASPCAPHAHSSSTTDAPRTEERASVVSRISLSSVASSLYGSACAPHACCTRTWHAPSAERSDISVWMAWSAASARPEERACDFCDSSSPWSEVPASAPRTHSPRTMDAPSASGPELPAWMA